MRLLRLEFEVMRIRHRASARDIDKVSYATTDAKLKGIGYVEEGKIVLFDAVKKWLDT